MLLTPQSLEELKRSLGRRNRFCIIDQEGKTLSILDKDSVSISKEIADILIQKVSNNDDVADHTDATDHSHFCAPVKIQGKSLAFLCSPALDLSKFTTRNVSKDDVRTRLSETAKRISYIFEGSLYGLIAEFSEKVNKQLINNKSLHQIIESSYLDIKKKFDLFVHADRSCVIDFDSHSGKCVWSSKCDTPNTPHCFDDEFTKVSFTTFIETQLKEQRDKKQYCLHIEQDGELRIFVPISFDGRKFKIIYLITQTDKISEYHLNLLNIASRTLVAFFEDKNSILRLQKIEEINKTFDHIKRYLEEQIHNKSEVFDLDRIIYSILTGITYKDFLGYSRAIFLYYDTRESSLIGKMGIGFKNSQYEQQCAAVRDLGNLDFDKCMEYYDKLRKENKLYSSEINPLVNNLNIRVVEGSKLHALLKVETQISQVVDGDNKGHFMEFNDLGNGELISAEYIIGILRLNGEPIGVLLIDNDFKRKLEAIDIDKRILAKDDLKPLDNFIAQAALTLDNAQLHKENLIFKKLTSTFCNVHTMKIFMDQVTDEINLLFEAEITSIFIYDNVKKQLCLYGISSQYRDSANKKDSIFYKPDEGWTGTIFSKKNPLRKNKNSTGARMTSVSFNPSGKLCNAIGVDDLEKRSFLGVPIMIGGSVKGVIWLLGSVLGRNFNVEEERQLIAAADYIGLKIFELFNTTSQIELKEAVFSKIVLDKLNNLKIITYTNVFGNDGFFITNANDYTKKVDVVIQETLEKILSNQSINMPIADLTRLLKDFEPLLQNIPRYRDHFIHQFQVFQLGCCIIDRYYYEFKMAYIKRYKKITKKKFETSNDITKNLEFTWFLAAAFHDIGYSLQEFDYWIAYYFEKLFKINDPLVNLNLEKITKERGYFYYLTEIVKDFTASTQIDITQGNEIYFSEYISNLMVDSRNHGVISAISIMFYLKDEFKGNDMQRRYQLKEALLAIILHDFNVWKETQAVYKFIDSLKGDKLNDCKYKYGCPNYQFRINFEENPIAFLLLLLDNIQEWGRPKAGKVRSPEDEFFLYKFELKPSECNFYLSLKKHDEKRVHDKTYYISTLEEILKSNKIRFNIIYTHKKINERGHDRDILLSPYSFNKEVSN